MRHALYVPPFGELADPRVLMELAAAAEAAGWDGFFLWDHLLRLPPDPLEVADAWTALAAVAVATTRLRLGPMVTPLTRRRPQKLAKEIVTVDLLAQGRVTVGLGLGVDAYGELSAFGEVVDPVERGDRLDEGAELLAALLEGAAIDHRGRHYTASGGVALRPPSQQRPRPPLWFAMQGPAPRPLRRATRYEGAFPIDVDADGVGRVADAVVAARGDLDGFDIAVVALPGVDLDAYAANGATWAMWAFVPGQSAAEAERFIHPGPDHWI